jgi:hypothetical protein
MTRTELRRRLPFVLAALAPFLTACGRPSTNTIAASPSAAPA